MHVPAYCPSFVGVHVVEYNVVRAEVKNAMTIDDMSIVSMSMSDMEVEVLIIALAVVDMAIAIVVVPISILMFSSLSNFFKKRLKSSLAKLSREEDGSYNVG